MPPPYGGGGIKISDYKKKTASRRQPNRRPEGFKPGKFTAFPNSLEIQHVHVVDGRSRLEVAVSAQKGFGLLYESRS